MKKITTLLILLLSLQTLSATIKWSEPKTISTASTDASDPQVVIDRNGNATAAWVETDIIITSSQPVDQEWSPPTHLSQSGASSPKLGIDSEGNITALWLENGIITSATLPFKGNWSTPKPISQTGASLGNLAIDSAGNAVAVWERSGFIESATKPAGNDWSSVNTISDIGNESNPGVAIGANGTIVAVWHTVVSGSDTIYSATSQLNGNWNPSSAIIAPDAQWHYHYPSVAVDPFGNAAAVWFSYHVSGSTYFNVAVMTASLPLGTLSWSQPTILDQNGLRNPADLMTMIRFDDNGNGIILWTNSLDGTTFNVQTSIQSVGSRWSPEGSLVLDNVYAFQGNLFVTSLGNTVAVYMFLNQSIITINSTETNIASPLPGRWTIPQVISKGSNNGYPRIGFSLKEPALYASAIWLQSNGVNNIIQATTGTKNTIQPPTNLSILQKVSDYGIFQDYYNVLSWDKSIEPNVLAYAIYRDDFFLFTVSPDTLQFIDHNAVQKGSVTYGVSTINMNNNCSPITTITFP